MRAIIMAGGEGKRLRPLTCTLPKPMAPVLGRPIIDYCVALLATHGFRDITATLQYLPRLIQRHLGDGAAFGVDIGYAIEEAPLGTAGSVRHALGDDLTETLVISGDALTDIDLGAALSFHRARAAGVTILLSRVDAPTEYGVVLLDEQKRVLRFLEKPGPAEVFSDLANTGIYILGPEALSLIPTEGVFDFSNDLFPLLMRENIPIYGYTAAGYWCDVGSLEAYLQAQRDMLDGKCRPALPVDAAYVAPDVRLSAGTTLIPPYFIGSGCEIAEAAIGPYAVLGRGCRIGGGSSVRHSVLMENVRLRGGVQVRGAVLCSGVDASPGASVFDGAAIGADARLERDVTVKPQVKVWPQRRLMEGKTYRENVIWDIGAAPLPTRGYGDGDMTPPHAAAIGCAFARLYAQAQNAVVCLATDGSQQAVMLKGALCSGILSQGVDVCDIGCASRAGFAFGVRMLGCAGGVYLASEDTPHMAAMLLHDEYGAELSTAAMRRFTQHLGEDNRAVTAARLGLLSHNDIARAYDAHLLRLLGREGIPGGTLVLHAPEPVFDTLVRVLGACGVRVLYSRSKDARGCLADMACAGARMGAVVDAERISALFIGEREWSTAERTAALMLRRVEEQREAPRLMLPVDIAEEYADMLRARGAQVKRVSSDPAQWLRACCQAGCYDPALFEPEAAIVKLMQLDAAGALEPLFEALPAVQNSSEQVRCSWQEMGKVLRSLVESENLKDVELLDGVRVRRDDGWVLIRPEGTAACRVVAQSMRAEYAQSLCDVYANKVRAARDAAPEK